jgi:hypothetical protein
MSHNQKRAALPSEPRRTLRADFTAYTIRHAAAAKRRAGEKQQFVTFLKEPFSMNSLKLLRTLPGAAMALVVIATGSAGAYALSNWFNGDVHVGQQASVFSVDLSQCKGALPPGVDSPDRSKVQFKILSDPHISAEQLQHQLLVQCEYDAVVDFYRQNPVTKDASLHIGSLKAIDGNVSMIFEYNWGGKMSQKTLRLASSATIYAQGVAAQVQDLHVGDKVVFATSPQAYIQEGTDPLSSVDEVQSIFRTQYDTSETPGASKKGFYEDNHIMPLDWYNQIHK